MFFGLDCAAAGAAADNAAVANIQSLLVMRGSPFRPNGLYAKSHEMHRLVWKSFCDNGKPSTTFLRNFYKFATTLPGLLFSIESEGWRRYMGLQTVMNSPYHYQDSHLELDFVRKHAALDAHRLVLTRKEYELLALLVENAGEIIPRQVLLMRVWGYSNEIRTRTLDVHVRRLRKKLGSYSEQYIETIFGIGYRFQPFRVSQRFAPGMGAAPLAVGA